MIVLSGVLAALVSALGAYLLAARRMSGRIETSAAKDLWDESAAMRTDYREQIAVLRLRITELEVAAKDSQLTIARLEGVIRDLRKTGGE